MLKENDLKLDSPLITGTDLLIWLSMPLSYFSLTAPLYTMGRHYSGSRHLPLNTLLMVSQIWFASVRNALLLS